MTSLSGLGRNLENESIQGRCVGKFWDDHDLISSAEVRYWLAVRAIREAVNQRLTGDPDLLFIEAWVRSFEGKWPLERALSVGCGAGELERGIVDLGVVRRCDGIDVGEASLEAARRASKQLGLDARPSPSPRRACPTYRICR